MSITLDPTLPPDTGETPRNGAQRIRNVAAAILQYLGFPGSASVTLQLPPLASVDVTTGLATVQGDPTVALGIATKQYVDAGAAPAFSGTATGTNTYAVTLSPAPANIGILQGKQITVTFTNGNIAPATLNVNGFGAHNIVKNTNQLLVSGDIPAGTTTTLVYDGTNFQLIGFGALPLTGGTISGNLSVTGTTTLSGNATVGGTLGVTGTTTAAAVNATNLHASGTLQAVGATTLAGVSATSITDSGTLAAGNTTVTGTLGVTGTSTLAGVAATSVTNSGNETIGGTLGITGTTTAAAVNATNLHASGTLQAVGASTLAAVSATTLSASSTLGVTGAATFSSTVGLAADPTTTLQAATKQYVDKTSAPAYSGSTTGTNTMAVTLSPVPASLAALQGIPLWLKIGTTNTSSTCTLNVNGLGAKSVLAGGGAATDLAIGALKGGLYYQFIYDGIEFLVGPNASYNAPAGYGNVLPAAGYALLPGGMVVQFGITDTITAGSNSTVSYDVAFNSGPTLLLAVPQNNSGGVAVVTTCSVSTFSTSAFKLFNTGAADSGFYWLAIGR